MDRFDALQAFVRVVEAGSFTKAAQTLHMSKTTVSQLIQQLEARLRVRLLNRTTRKVQVTADGEAYYARVVRLLADLKEADASLSGGAAVPSGRLRVDVPSPFALLVLVPGLPEFHARYPDIQLDLGVSDRMVDVIGDNVDCVIRGGELPDSSLIARRIAELPFGFYAAPAYLEQVGRPTHPLELEAEPHRIVGFLGARSATVTPMTMAREAERVTVRGRYAVALDDGNACLAAGLAGMGVLAVPAELYGRGERAARGVADAVRGLAGRAYAFASASAAEPAYERQVAGVHRLGGRADRGASGDRFGLRKKRPKAKPSVDRLGGFFWRNVFES